MQPSDDHAAQPPASAGRRPGPLERLLAYTRGLIVDQHLRRQTMYYTEIAEMVMIFAGGTFLEDWLDWHYHVMRFAGYWLACGWLTILTALLAVYDLLMLRLQHRILRRELRARCLGEQHRHDTDEK